MKAEIDSASEVCRQPPPVKPDIIKNGKCMRCCPRTHESPFIKDSGSVVHRVLKKEIPFAHAFCEQLGEDFSRVAFDECDLDRRKVAPGTLDILLSKATEFNPILHWNRNIRIPIVIDRIDVGAIAIRVGSTGHRVGTQPLKCARFDDDAGLKNAHCIHEPLGAFGMGGPFMLPAARRVVERMGGIADGAPCGSQTLHRSRYRTPGTHIMGRDI